MALNRDDFALAQREHDLQAAKDCLMKRASRMLDAAKKMERAANELSLDNRPADKMCEMMNEVENLMRNFDFAEMARRAMELK